MHRKRLSMLLLVLFALVVVAVGCGGSKKKADTSSGASSTSTPASTGDPVSVLKSIKTDTSAQGPAKIALNLGITIQGTPTGTYAQYAAFVGKPITFSINGSTDTAAKKIDATFSAALGPLNVTGAVRSDGTNSWLEFNNKWYTLPANALNGTSTSGTTTSKIDTSAVLKAFGDPTKLITNPQDKGEETIDGVKTEHISGQVDVAALVSGIANLSSSVGSTSTPVQPAQISQAIDKIKQYIQGATVDVWVGTDDHIIHKLATNITGTLDDQTKTSTGLTGFNLTFDVTSTPTSSPSISAPPNPAPISQLQQDLGQVLGGLSPTGVPPTPSTVAIPTTT